MIRFVCLLFVLSALLLLSVPAAHAHSGAGEFMNFNQLGDMQQVGNFYNGTGGSSIPNYGVSFSSNFYGLRSIYAPVHPGSGNFSLDPTQTPAIFIMGNVGSQVTGTMNVSNGFSAGLNFFYTAAFKETVTVWSGSNGTGTILATLTLSPNDGSCKGPAYCTWTSAGLTFNGTAKSVTFSGTADGIGISDMTIGQSTTAIPEPSSVYLLGAGLSAVALVRMRRFFLA